MPLGASGRAGSFGRIRVRDSVASGHRCVRILMAYLLYWKYGDPEIAGGGVCSVGVTAELGGTSVSSCYNRCSPGLGPVSSNDKRDGEFVCKFLGASF